MKIKKLITTAACLVTCYLASLISPLALAKDSEQPADCASRVAIQVYDWQYTYVDIDGYHFPVEDSGEYVLIENYQAGFDDRTTFEELFYGEYLNMDLKQALLDICPDTSQVIGELVSLGEIPSNCEIRIYVKDDCLDTYEINSDDNYNSEDEEDEDEDETELEDELMELEELEEPEELEELEETGELNEAEDSEVLDEMETQETLEETTVPNEPEDTKSSNEPDSTNEKTADETSAVEN